MAADKGVPAADTEAPPKGKSKKLIIIVAGAVLLLGGGGAAAYMLVPGLHGKPVAAKAAGATTIAATKPTFVELPEITVTLPNAGQSRQLRIHLAIEVAKTEADGKPSAEISSPRVYDSLITYLRTLQDSEVDGAISIDRIRGDLFRRLDLLLGPGVVRDVLVTGLVIA
jgi:flagellar FliL protein